MPPIPGRAYNDEPPVGEGGFSFTLCGQGEHRQGEGGVTVA